MPRWWVAEFYGYHGGIRALNHVVSQCLVPVCQHTLTLMLTAVEYALAILVSVSLLVLLAYAAFFLSVIFIGLFSKCRDPLTEELDEFLDGLLGPNASPWREPERLHGKRHR